jgi:hypothetical protein
VRDLGRPRDDVNLPHQLAAGSSDPYVWALTPPNPLDPPGVRDRTSIEDPLTLARIAVAGILLFATIVALLLWATGLVPKALVLVGVLWALYGFALGLLGGVLEPMIDGLGRAFGDVGLIRAGSGYSAIETLVAQGRYDEAAEAYRERAQVSADRAEATLRRAALLAGVLHEPETAAVELENLRTAGHHLTPAEDIRVGLALAEVAEHRLGDPGRAMVELRRLIDRYPSGRHLRRLRAELAELKEQRFRSAPTT